MEETDFYNMKSSIVKHLAIDKFSFSINNRKLEFSYNPDDNCVIFNGKKYGPINFWDAVDTVCDAGEIIDTIFHFNC